MNELMPPDGFADEENGPPDGFADEKGFLGNLSENVGQTLQGISRMGQGIIDFPGDVYQTGKQLINRQDFGKTPIGQDVSTVGNTLTQMSPRIVSDPRQGGKWRLEPGSIYRQYEEIAAQPLKLLPGKAGEEFKKEFPENPFYKRPLDTALAVSPILGKTGKMVREIPAVDEALNATSKGLRENVVAPLARRTLGKFPSKNPQMISQANQAGLEAIDKGIIKNPITNPLSSSPKSMLGRTTKISDQIGEEIGKFLNSQNEGLDVTKALNELESVKSRFPDDPMIARKVDATKEIINRTAGIKKDSASFKTVGVNTSPIEESFPSQRTVDLRTNTKQKSFPSDTMGISKKTEVDLMPGESVVGGKTFSNFVDQKEPGLNLTKGKYVVGTGQPTPLLGVYGKQSPRMDFSKANKLKGYLQGKVNYKSDAATQNVGQAIAGNFKDSIDSQLDQLANKFGGQSENMKFLKDKKQYSSLSKIEDALNDRISRESRNMPLSLPSLGAGLAGLFHGGGLKGVAATLATEWTRRYGSATAATMINDLSKLINTKNIPAVSPLVGGIPAAIGSFSEGVDQSVENAPVLGATAGAYVENTKGPYGNRVKQDGIIYKWNGQEYVEE